MLHKRNVLVCGSVENHVRSVQTEHTVKSRNVTHRSYFNYDIQLVLIKTDKLLLDGVGVIFINIEDNKSFWLAFCYLTAQLASNRSASARYKYGLAVVILLGGGIVDD